MSSIYQESSITESYAGYVQGAGDDAESWARGLTPQVFWSNHTELLAASEDELPDLIDRLLQEAKATSVEPNFTPILPASQIMTGSMPQGTFNVDDKALVVMCTPTVDENLQKALSPRLLHLKTTVGKLGSRDLRIEIPKVIEFFDDKKSFSSIIVTCPTGMDISAGVVLALLCLYFDEEGQSLPGSS